MRKTEIDVAISLKCWLHFLTLLELCSNTKCFYQKKKMVSDEIKSFWFFSFFCLCERDILHFSFHVLNTPKPICHSFLVVVDITQVLYFTLHYNTTKFRIVSSCSSYWYFLSFIYKIKFISFVRWRYAYDVRWNIFISKKLPLKLKIFFCSKNKINIFFNFKFKTIMLCSSSALPHILYIHLRTPTWT